MPNDSTSREPAAPRPNWQLPKVRNIQIRRVPYLPKRRRNFQSALSDYKEALEFLVETDGPIPTRALGPALYVGDMPVTEGQVIKENVYRFIAFEIAKLPLDAPITLGWAGGGDKSIQTTRFRFRL